MHYYVRARAYRADLYKEIDRADVVLVVVVSLALHTYVYTRRGAKSILARERERKTDREGYTWRG